MFDIYIAKGAWVVWTDIAAAHQWRGALFTIGRWTPARADAAKPVKNVSRKNAQPKRKKTIVL